MKKIKLLILIALIISSLCACSNSSSEKESVDSATEKSDSVYNSNLYKVEDEEVSDYNSYYSDNDYDDKDYNYDSDYDTDYDDYDYDYDKGYGYTEPEEGESFSDYVKRQDPELYESMKDRLESLD